MVECSFRTEFKDHLFISMDAEIILFIHDLITSYMHEKDSGNAGLVCFYMFQNIQHSGKCNSLCKYP